MRSRRLKALAALAIAALPLLALPGAAAAKPGYYVSPESHLAFADLAGSNGYRVTIAAFGPRYVALLATKRGSSASYNVRAPFDGKRIDARFGKLGKVSVRFEPDGPPEREDEPGANPCKGRAGTSQSGRFIGTIRFRGEGGFTAVKRSAVRATVFHSFRQVCKRPPQGKVTEPHLDKATSVSAVVRGNPEGPVFTAYSVPAEAGLQAEGPNFTASVTDRRPSMTVVRSASATGGPDAFAVSPLGTVPATATVSPPSPFEGSATLTKTPGGATTWTGDLEAELPGLGTIPLTGPSFAAKLCRNISCACNRRQLCVSFSVVESRRLQLLQRLRRR